MDWLPTIIVPLWNRGRIAFERPSGSGPSWSSAFERVTHTITREYLDRRQAARGARRDGANAWLMRVAYDLLLIALEDGQLDELTEWNATHRRYAKNNVQTSLNPFQIGLTAMFATVPKAITPQTRERLGKRIWHASRHFAPPEFVVGFIGQLDSIGLEHRAANNFVEDGFDHWIATKIVEGAGMLERGSYPRRIDELASRLKNA